MCGLLNDEKEKVCSKCSNPRVAGLVEHDVVNGNDDDDSDDANRDDFVEEATLSQPGSEGKIVGEEYLRNVEVLNADDDDPEMEPTKFNHQIICAWQIVQRRKDCKRKRRGGNEEEHIGWKVKLRNCIVRVNTLLPGLDGKIRCKYCQREWGPGPSNQSSPRDLPTMCDNPGCEKEAATTEFVFAKLKCNFQWEKTDDVPGMIFA